MKIKFRSLYLFLFFSLSRFEAIPDNLTPEEILAQAQEAAKEAADMLTLREPKAQVSISIDIFLVFSHRQI